MNAIPPIRRRPTDVKRARWALPGKDADRPCLCEGIYPKTGKRYSVRATMITGELGG